MSCVEPDLDERAIFEAARRVLADPDRVVEDPEHLYENDYGAVAHLPEATRGCFLGAIQLGLRDLGVPIEEIEAARPRLAEMESERMRPVLMERHGMEALLRADTDAWTYTLREQGAKGCIEVIDEVLRRLR